MHLFAHARVCVCVGGGVCGSLSVSVSVSVCVSVCISMRMSLFGVFFSTDIQFWICHKEVTSV